MKRDFKIYIGGKAMSAVELEAKLKTENSDMKKQFSKIYSVIKSF